MKITLSGLAGSGKSTLAKLIAKELSIEFVSVGSFTRDFAMREFGMDINEFQDYCKEHPAIDIQIDNEMTQFCNEQENLVIDYRLGPKFIKDALHVYLEVTPEEAHRRISNAGRSGEKTTSKDINKRNQMMRERFIETYDFDFADPNNFDLILNTESLSLIDMTEIIINNLKKKN